MIDLDKLEALAKDATPGPWHWVNRETDEPRSAGEWNSSLRTVEVFPTQLVGPLPKFIVEADEICDENMEANADFIAAANPATILALIAEVRSLRAGEPNMRHPKIQAILSSRARYQIELSLIESLIDDPEYEYTPTDHDYTTALTEKVEAFVKAARGAK
jgi:hypothetical protein